MKIIDFHAHILPGIDDGSRDAAMSEQMLRQCAVQGIDTVIATPHFYADRETLEHFLKKRASACDRIRDAAKSQRICLLCGAEVAFFSGMGTAQGMEKLTVADTPLLLLEMPFRPWTPEDLKEVRTLIRRGLTPVMAHLERFYPYQKNRRIFDELYSLPVLVQVNAEALLHWKTKGLALKLFREEKAHLLGSDCHNTGSRPQNLAAGRKIIEQKLGRQRLDQMDRLGREVLHDHEKTEKE